MPTSVITTPEADAQAAAAAAWWREYRPDARGLFRRELAAALSMLADFPESGVSYRRSRLKGVQRVLLMESRYHVYYVHDAGLVVVLAIWGARRGRGPRLRAP